MGKVIGQIKESWSYEIQDIHSVFRLVLDRNGPIFVCKTPFVDIMNSVVIKRSWIGCKLYKFYFRIKIYIL